MKNPFSSLTIGLVLCATVVVPPYIYTALETSSMAAGVLLVSGLYVFLFVMLGAYNWPTRKLVNVALIVVVSLAVVLTQGALSLLVNDEFNFDRFWQSEVFLTISIAGAFALARLSEKFSEFQADLAVKMVFYVLFLSGLAGILKYSPISGGAFSKPVMFFAEPSHFALSFLPFLLYMVVLSSFRMKFFFSFCEPFNRFLFGKPYASYWYFAGCFYLTSLSLACATRTICSDTLVYCRY